jgi:secreted PhoX family phosphatase
MPDNIAYQASRGNWIIEEDGSTGDFIDGSRNNDIWDCLGDGADDDTLSDGRIRVASLNDLDAESTGGFFDATGQDYYVSIQHNSSGSAPSSTAQAGAPKGRQQAGRSGTSTAGARAIPRRGLAPGAGESTGSTSLSAEVFGRQRGGGLRRIHAVSRERGRPVTTSVQRS